MSRSVSSKVNLVSPLLFGVSCLNNLARLLVREESLLRRLRAQEAETESQHERIWLPLAALAKNIGGKRLAHGIDISNFLNSSITCRLAVALSRAAISTKTLARWRHAFGPTNGNMKQDEEFPDLSGLFRVLMLGCSSLMIGMESLLPKADTDGADSSTHMTWLTHRHLAASGNRNVKPWNKRMLCGLGD
jgi:hypothetical protein